MFETRWAEAQWLRDVMSGIREGCRSAALRDGDTFFVERALSRRDVVHRRLTDGFQCFGEEVGGRYRAPFTETRLRSDRSHVLRRIVQLTPRTPSLMSGRTKDVMTKGDSKLLSLDNPWIVLNLAGTASRQAIGGRYAAALRASRAAETLRSTVQAALVEGAPITKSEIARRSGLSRPTVLKHWAAAESLITTGTSEV